MSSEPVDLSASPPAKPDLIEHEEEAVPFEEVMQKLLGAKPVSAKSLGRQPKQSPE